MGVNTLFEFKKMCVEGQPRCPKGKARKSRSPLPTHGKEVENMKTDSAELKDNKQESLKDKYMLTVKEAAFYFNIGTKKMRRIAEDNLGNIAVYSGNRFLIIRPKFEDFIRNSSEI